jgi:hypothetical protein
MPRPGKISPSLPNLVNVAEDPINSPFKVTPKPWRHFANPALRLEFGGLLYNSKTLAQKRIPNCIAQGDCQRLYNLKARATGIQNSHNHAKSHQSLGSRR